MNLKKTETNREKNQINIVFSATSGIITFFFLMIPYLLYIDNVPMYYPHWFSSTYLHFSVLFFIASQIVFWYPFGNKIEEFFLKNILYNLGRSTVIAIFWPVLWFFPIHKKLNKVN